MLVLSRKTGEEIVIDGNIRVSVVAIKGGSVRIGITAPDKVPVDRSEIHAIRSEFLTSPDSQTISPIHNGRRSTVQTSLGA